jgi:aminodeoxyfutalosine synthase
MISDYITHIEDLEVREVAKKVQQGERISTDDALILFTKTDLSLLALMANHVRNKINGDKVYYVRNYHIEPTNVCIHKCKFCSYSARVSGHAWEFSPKEMLEKVNSLDDNIVELHIVGGVSEGKGVSYFAPILKEIKKIRPNIHIKAFTAVEIQGMAAIDGISIEEALLQLKESGFNSMPGGGAEIFDETLRAEICPTKSTAEEWLSIHRKAHQLGIPTNATILYGFFETYQHRVDHLNRLRNLQDETHGFNAFIPLKFKNKNNEYSNVPEVSIVEDLKNFAVSRIFLDNVPHLKSYWPVSGIENARISLHYGVDDLDGTINNSTKIYTMAGSEDASMTAENLNQIIISEGFSPQERDALYNEV